ncbi:MAG: S-layer protein [Cyanobacteriota bacterium]|nr:S-layer protein [Cyanobacteriota bacterium]
MGCFSSARLWLIVVSAGLVGLTSSPAFSQTAMPSSTPIGNATPSGDISWTQAYATALETQTDLVVNGEPLSNTLTRIELAGWLAEFFGYIPDRTQAQPIRDIEADTPDYWTAQALLQSGVMRLYDGSEFRPLGNITKLEALAIMVRALQVAPPDAPVIDDWLAQYQDAGEVPEVGRAFVAMAGQAGLILNVPDPQKLSPNLVLRRGEGAALLHQTLVARGLLTPLSPPVAQLVPASAPIAATTPTTGIPNTSPESGKPEILATRLTPETGTIPAGGSLTIEMQGTANGEAIADINGTVQGILMTEVSPGFYRATYSPTLDDAYPSPDIGIQLTVNGASTRVQQRQPQLVIGNAAPPPVNTAVFPNGNGVATPIPPATPPLGSVSPPLPLAANTPPLFNGIQIQPQQNLQEGDILTVSVWGVSGGIAQFSVGNFASTQPMREIKPNVYQGTYVVAPSDRAVNPPIQISLSKDGQTSQHQEIYPFTVDGSVGTRSTIQASNPAPAGQGQPQITSITVNPANQQLEAGDILTITMRGDMLGRATFEILNYSPPVEMQEISPGLYEGKVKIPATSRSITNGTLQVNLERNGQKTFKASPSPINIVP